jgi:hypothetical protein
MSVGNASRVRQKMREVQEKIEAGELEREIDSLPMLLILMKTIIVAVIDYGNTIFNFLDFSAEIRGEPLQDF